jgi:hypothetical protein
MQAGGRQVHHKQPVVFPEMGVPPILLISCFAAWGVAANMTDPLGIWIGIAVARMPTAREAAADGLRAVNFSATIVRLVRNQHYRYGLVAQMTLFSNLEETDLETRPGSHMTRPREAFDGSRRRKQFDQF